MLAAGRVVSNKLWQTDIITKNKISGYLVGNDQVNPKHNYNNNNNHFYRKKRTERKGTNSNMYGLIRR